MHAAHPTSKKVAREDRPCVKRQTFQHRKSEQNAKKCDYCILSGGAYERQRCSEYHKRCFNCNKRDHFKVVCRTMRHIKERIYTHRNIKPGTGNLKKAELATRRSEESDRTSSTKPVGHLTNRKVIQRGESRGIYQIRDILSARLQRRKRKILWYNDSMCNK